MDSQIWLIISAEFWSVLIGRIGKIPFEFYGLLKVKEKSAKN